MVNLTDSQLEAIRSQLVSRFQWPEYTIFGLMLAISAFIGIYYGFIVKKKKSTEEFLMAGRQMGVLPVAMSLIASFMSAITLLGTPSEVYQNGMVYWWIGFSYFFVMPSAAYLYFPVFWKLEVTSCYEYLERRFNKAVRTMGSVIFIIQMCLYMSVVVYAPALALSQVTGMNVYVSVTVIFVVVIFYTTLGGMKAVMWTDTVQVVIMFTAMLTVIFKGMVDAGGFNHVWNMNQESGRLEVDHFEANPAIRHTFWTLVVGGYFTWVTIYGVNQAQVQRYLTVQKRWQAQAAIWINLFGLFALMVICAFGGMVIYAKYLGCDPLQLKTVTKADQLFPLFVMDTLGDIPGLPGLFVAGIFSGALSTVSSGLNSLAAITLKDLVMNFCVRGKLSDQKATLISQILSVTYGVLCFGLVFVASQLGDILQAALSIFGIVGGPLLGVFSLGMFFPWANSVGAITGTLSSLAFMLWIGFGAQISKANKLILPCKKPVYFDIRNCTGVEGELFNLTHINFTIPEDYSFTTTEAPECTEPNGDALGIYHLSYMWYSATGCSVVVIIGLIISFMIGKQDPRELNPDLISPPYQRLMRKLLPSKYWGVGDHYTPEPEVDLTEPKRFENGAYYPGMDNPAFSKEQEANRYHYDNSKL